LYRLAGQLAEGGKLFRRIGPLYLIRNSFPNPLKKTALAYHWMLYEVARASLLDGRPSSSNGQPSSPTMSKFVRFVTAWLGIPPCWRTTSKASARLMHTSRPVKATEPLSAELSSSPGIMTSAVANGRLTFG